MAAQKIIIMAILLLTPASVVYAKTLKANSEKLWLECSLSTYNHSSKTYESDNEGPSPRYGVDIKNKIVKIWGWPQVYQIRSITNDYIVFGRKVKMASGGNGDAEITIGRKNGSYHNRFKTDENVEDDYADDDFLKNAVIQQGSCKKISPPKPLF
jgi:hypothetical protein